MLEIYLKSPGKPFRKANGKVVRTPIKFYVDESERQIYESLIRVSSIKDFTITEVDYPIDVRPHAKVPKLSLNKPRTEIRLGFKIRK